MSIKEALRTIGGLSNPSKMPGASYSVPAWRCSLGAVLATVAGTICSGCYALAGAYAWPNVQRALERRYALLQRAVAQPRFRAAFVRAFVYILTTRANRAPQHRAYDAPGSDPFHFRWFDSGDLQPGWLDIICSIANRTPRVRHWLPTRERKLVEAYLRAGGTIPRNLRVRLSAARIGAPAPHHAVLGFGSTAHDTVAPPAGALACPAGEATEPANRSCAAQACRYCWTEPGAVSYRMH